MKLLKVDNWYVWQGGYETKDIPKAAKFRWNADKKRWETNILEYALNLREYAEEPLRSELEGYLKRYEDSAATDADVNIPAPDGLSYFGYQRAGIAYAMNNPNVLIGDEMGLGKTIQAIGVINAVPTINKIMIVCPASLKLNWKRELSRWLVRDLEVKVITSSNKSKVDADILIVNYDILTRLSWLHTLNCDLLIADECHYLKNPKAQRTMIFTTIREHAERLILLTGTPILNRPVEMWNLLRLLKFDMKEWYYYTRYCGASKENGWDKSGATNMEELQVKLRREVMIRREKAQVLADLPPKTRQIIYLDPENYLDVLDAEQKFLSMDEVSNYTVYEDGVLALHEPSTRHISEMAKLRHATAMAKVGEVIAHAKTVLESTDKVVIFAHHQDVIAALYEAFQNEAVALVGGMSAALKDNAVYAFQNDPRIRVFIGSIQAAGVGLTLTAASTVIFAELDWVPANLTQAEDRCHRIGQFGNVLVYHVVVDGSMDAMLAKRIVAKQDIIDRATLKTRSDAHLESQRMKLEAIGTDVRARIEEAKRVVETNAKEAPEPSQSVKPGFTTYTTEQREHVHDLLKRLAGVCNYAVSEDGMGFNKIDADFGHQLANQAFLLTNKQTFVAIKMLRKYHGQIGKIEF